MIKNSFHEQMYRFVWSTVWRLVTFFLPRSMGNCLKIMLLKLFGAKVKWTSVVYSSADIYLPCNLEMDEFACLASDVNCYNVDKVILGKFVTVSQGSYLCTASHNIDSQRHELIHSPIIIMDKAWVATDVFIGMGVTIGYGAVVGARACVFKDVKSLAVVGGNPAQFLRNRTIYE